MVNIRAVVLGILFSLCLHAGNTFKITIPMHDDSGVDHGLVVEARTKTYELIKSWRIAYKVWRFGRIADLVKPVDVEMQWDIGGLCAKKPEQWTSVSTPESITSSPTYGDFDIEQSVGCTIDIIKVSLISTHQSGKLITSTPAPFLVFADQLKAIQARRDRLAAENKLRQAEEDARHAKYKTEKEAQEAAERAKIRAVCLTIYKGTSDKRVGDLTVKEEQQVRACQLLSLYPPHQ
jgi:hypothetical protein